MEDSTGFEEQPGGPAAILEAVKKFGIAKVILIAVVLVAALWFFVLAPKNGTLTLRFSEIDSGEKIEGVQIDLTPPGQKTATKFSSGSGSASFSDVPSVTELSLDVLPPSGYRISSDLESPLTLKSAESKTVSVTLARDASLTVKPAVDQMALGTDCQTTLPVSVKNNGDAAFTVQLVGDGVLKDVLEIGEQSVPPQSEKTFDVKVAAPAKKGKAAGKIRVRLTDASAPFTLDVTDPEQLRTNPSNYDERVGPSDPIKKQFIIENTGRSGEARDIQASVSGDFEQLGARVTLSDDLPLKPKQTKVMTLELTAPSSDGESVGVLILTSACQRIQIPLRLQVESRR